MRQKYTYLHKQKNEFEFLSSNTATFPCMASLRSLDCNFILTKDCYSQKKIISLEKPFDVLILGKRMTLTGKQNRPPDL